MARELKGLVAGLAAGLGVVGLAYGVSAVGTRITSPETKQAEAKQAVPTEKTKAGGGQSAQLVATGRTLYLRDCAGCHGLQGQGQIGPKLLHLGDPDEKVERNIANGFPPRMPGFKSQYSDAQLKAVVAYVQSLE